MWPDSLIHALVLTEFRRTFLPGTATLLSWLVLAGGIATILFTVTLIVLAYSPVASVDHWFFLYEISHRKTSFWGPDISHARASTLQILWAQHNDHRIVFPKVLYLADLALFKGRSIFLLVSVCISQLGELFLLAYLLARSEKVSGNEFRSAIGV